MKTYRGFRDEGGRAHVVVDAGDGHYTPLVHHVVHSPDGFEWGYGGSGPSELARCLLIDLLGQVPHPGVYQRFKCQVLVPLVHDDWSMTEADVQTWVHTILFDLGIGCAFCLDRGVCERQDGRRIRTEYCVCEAASRLLTS